MHTTCFPTNIYSLFSVIDHKENLVGDKHVLIVYVGRDWATVLSKISLPDRERNFFCHEPINLMPHLLLLITPNHGWKTEVFPKIVCYWNPETFTNNQISNIPWCVAAETDSRLVVVDQLARHPFVA